MYTKLLKKIKVKKENLSPYKGFDFLSFKGTLNFPWGYIKLIVTLGEGIEVGAIDV